MIGESDDTGCDRGGATADKTRPKCIGLSAYGYLAATRVALRQSDEVACEALWVLNGRERCEKLMRS